MNIIIRDLDDIYIEILERLKDEYQIKTNSKMILAIIKEFESSKMISKKVNNSLMKARTELELLEKNKKKISNLVFELNRTVNEIDNEDDYY